MDFEKCAALVIWKIYHFFINSRSSWLSAVVISYIYADSAIPSGHGLPLSSPNEPAEKLFSKAYNLDAVIMLKSKQNVCEYKSQWILKINWNITVKMFIVPVDIFTVY